MSRYRRIESRLWQDPAFVALTDAERLVALYLLSGPPTNSVGVYRLSPAAAAEDLGWSAPTFCRRLAVVCDALRWRFDPTARVLWIPEWVRDNSPANPNAVKAFRAAFDEIPDCALKAEAAAAIRAVLATRGEQFAEPFAEPFAEQTSNAPVPDPEFVERFAKRAHRAVSGAQTRKMVDRLRERREQKAAGIEQAEQVRRS